MAGKIIADQIEHSTAGSLDTQYVVQGSAKAWVNFSMAGTTARDSLNLSSLTDTTTGKFNIAMSSAFTDADYTCLLYTSPSPRDRQKSRMPSSA